MSERFLDPRTPGGLEMALVDLRDSLAVPTPSPVFVARVTARIRAAGASPARAPWWRRMTPPPGRSFRRALLVAVALVIIVAAVAGALGLGLPGIRIFQGPAPSLTPGPSLSPGAPSLSPAASPSGPPGSGLGLGSPTALADVPTSVSFGPKLPAAAGVGAPDAAYVDSDRLTFAWAPKPSLPATLAANVGLLLTEFKGKVNEGYYGKTVDSGTAVEPVSVNGNQGFWIDGVPHFFFYVDKSGAVREETRRFVGKVLIWTDGDLTLRLETSLSRDEAIAIASSIP